MEKYESYDAYMAALEKRGQLPEGFRTAVLPLSFFPEETRITLIGHFTIPAFTDEKPAKLTGVSTGAFAIANS